MSTIIKFTPLATANFTFQCTLDSSNYNAIITWNMFSQRYYINLYTQNGTLVFCLPVIGSINGYDINLAGGYFQNSMLVFRSSSQSFEIIP